MPCYLFTYRAYCSWLPDREEGYVRRHEGRLDQSILKGEHYRNRALAQEVTFEELTQEKLIDAALKAAEKQIFRLHYVATEPNHVHILISWNDERDWQRMRRSLKTSLWAYLKKNVADHVWLSEGGSRKRVFDETHYNHLVGKYLLDHGGWKWSSLKGKFR